MARVVDKPSPGALAGFLGRKERIENLVLNLPGNSRAGVRHRDAHVWANFGLRIHAGIGFVEHHIFHLDGQFAALGHGVARVDAEVQQDLVQLRRVAGDGPQVGNRMELQTPPILGKFRE